MAVQAFSNANLVNGLCGFNCNIAGFIPAASYAYDAEAATVTVTNSSTVPAGDTFAKMKVEVTDQFGNEVRNNGTVAGTPLVLDVSTLNRSKQLNLQVHIITTNRLFADGGAYLLGVAGTVNSWDKSN